MSREIEFGTREAANDARDLVEDQYLTGRYDRRYATIEVVDDTPEGLLEELEDLAATSRAEQEGGAGQADLTDGERRRFDFSREGINIPKLRSIKAIMLDAGVSDWTAHVDPTLRVQEHYDVAETAVQEGGGERLDAEDSDDEIRARHRRQAEGAKCDHALDHCADGDGDACDFLVDVCGFDREEAERLVTASEDDDAELTGEAYGALSKLWNQYKAAISDAKSAAAGINGVREEVGQDPLEFDELGGRTIDHTDINS
jgi:hypothetical protein